MSMRLPMVRAFAGWLATVLSLTVLCPASPVTAQSSTGRIVSLGGSVTEILYELGVGDHVVGVDTTSVHPPEVLKTKPNVGYLRQLSAEGILSLRPDLVIAVDGAGPPDVLKLVEGAGVRVAFVPDTPSPEGVRAKVEAVSRLVGRDREGADLATRISTGFAALEKARATVQKPVRALFVLSNQNGRIMVGGRDTTANGALTLAGAENVATAIQGYKPMSDEAVTAAAPDVVVTMSHGPGGAANPQMLSSPAFAGTPAGRNGRLVVVDGALLLGFGPREPQAARDLMVRLYPGLKIE